MRQGFGTKVLNFLIQESSEAGAKVMWVFSGEEAMQNFLLKHNFTQFAEGCYF